MKNYADQGGCYSSRLEVEVDNILQDLHKFLRATVRKNRPNLNFVARVEKSISFIFLFIDSF